jgi:diguanylate cyclase (GGDEF)-like protein
MPAALPPRRLLFAASAASGAAIFAALLAFERPGLGLGRFFFVSIALVALGTGPLGGTLAGAAATALYGVAVAVNPELPGSLLWSAGMGVRVATFVGLGALVGYFAQQHRVVVDHLRLLAERDSLTGLPSGRAFENAITERLAHKHPFAVLLGDVHALGEGDDAMQRFASLAGKCLAVDDVVARVGRDQFAIVTADRTTDEAAQRAATLEGACAGSGVSLTFGWAVAPQDGDNGLALCRAADERLYARKLLRGVA